VLKIGGIMEFENIKILLVDDDKQEQSILSMMLEKISCKIILASDGYEGLIKFKEQSPNIILTDIKMPKFDGFEMIEEIQKINADVPIILLTSFSEEEYLIKAINLGVKYFLKKPINFKELEKTIYNTAKNFLMAQEILNKSLIIDSSPYSILTIDLNGKIKTVNKFAVKFFLQHAKEIIGKNIFEFLGIESLKGIIEEDNVKTKIIDLEINVNGKKIFVNLRIHKLYNLNNKKNGYIIIVHDLTGIKGLQAEILNKYTYQNIIGKSKRMTDLFDILPNISMTDVPVLITGESGTGKELLVNAIHNLSARNKMPLIKINCAALPETLFEAELFGYKKGAFTDAKYDKPGRIETAEKGTLFFDEIGDMPLALQAKLLRLIQQKEYDVLGCCETKTADVRIVAATNKNLQKLINEEKFREDLYYRLCVVNIDLPSLRDRKDDLPELIAYFIKKFNIKYNKNIEKFNHDSLDILMDYDYPGNIRELENIVEHSFILCNKNIIDETQLPKNIFNLTNDKINTKISVDKIDNNCQNLNNLKLSVVNELLRKYSNDKLKVAQELGIHYTTLWRWLKRQKEKVPEKVPYPDT